MSDDTKPKEGELLTAPKVGRLASQRSIRREQRRVYLDTRLGKITPSFGGQLAYQLQNMSKTLESEQIEARLVALEGRAGAAETRIAKRLGGPLVKSH
jgi:hypothetical protein